jgi:signal transduction histidine kinase
MLAFQPVAGGLLHTLAGSLAVIVLRVYHLPDLRNTGRRAGTYLVTTVVCAGLYAGVYIGAQSVMQSTRRFPPLLLGGFLAVLLALLFQPLVNLVQRFIHHWMIGTRYDPRQMVGDYSQSISNILDMERLAAAALGQIRNGLDITHGALIAVSYEHPVSAFSGKVTIPLSHGTFVLRPISGASEPIADIRLSAGNPAVTSWLREHRPLSQYDIDVLPRYQSMEPGERERLTALHMDVFVPIYAQQLWIGLLALGPRASGERYFDEDLAIVQTLADQTAVALENARLYADLVQRSKEIEQLNTDLRQANSELSRLDQAKSDFINIASHELRTPLTQVIGYNDILADMIRSNSISQQEAAVMSGAVRRAARRLEEIVDTMFDVSKLEARTLDLACAPVPLVQVLQDAVHPWTAAIEERSLKLSIQEIQSLPSIFADGKRLAQVFTQLVQNAIKSTPDGGQITISGRLMESAGEGSSPGFVEVVVEDTGIGIAPEELERIFVKFYRVGNVLLHSSGNTKFKGAGPGLGLTIARGIVEAHGGRIWAESKGFDEQALPGAKFHVVLPVEPVTPQTAAANERSILAR